MYRDVDVVDMPKEILAMINLGVGDVRTDKFNLDDFFDLHDPNRFTYDNSNMMKMIDRGIDRVTYVKAMSLLDNGVSDVILTTLKTPQHGKITNKNSLRMFLEYSRETIDTDKHSQ